MREQRIPLIIFLTDGEPTSGVTVGSHILANAQQVLKGTISLFGLAFGDDADYGLLRRLSLENRGVARRIYEDTDATLQLKGFYDEIASPLLYDVELAYLDGVAQDLTQNLFPNYFQGSELVVAGRVKPGASDLRVRTMGHGQEGQLSLENDISANATEASSFGCSGDVSRIGHFVQRLWAYFTIQDLLRARFRANDTATRCLLTEKATNLSLKYNFVTPVTSLIVVRQEEDREKGQPTRATTIPPEVTRAFKATPALGTSASLWLSKVARTPPLFTMTNDLLVTKASKSTTGPGAPTTSPVPAFASGITKATFPPRATAPPIVTMTTIKMTYATPPGPTAPSRTKVAKVAPVLGVTATSPTPVVTRGSNKPPRAPGSLWSTRPPIKPPKPSTTRAGTLKVTVQPLSALETRGTAMVKILARGTSTMLMAPTAVHPPGSAKAHGGNSSTWGQPETAAQTATEQQPHTNVQDGTIRVEIGNPPWSKTIPKSGAAMEAHTEKPPQTSSVSWGTAPGITSLVLQGTELEGTSRTPSTTIASDISLLLLPGESELHSTTDLDMEYVESLNPPAVYSFIATRGLSGRWKEPRPALQFCGFTKELHPFQTTHTPRHIKCGIHIASMIINLSSLLPISKTLDEQARAVG